MSKFIIIISLWQIILPYWDPSPIYFFSDYASFVKCIITISQFCIYLFGRPFHFGIKYICFQPRWIKWTLQIFHMVHIPYFLHWRRAFSQISPLLLAMVKRWLINNLIVWIMKSILAFIVNFYLIVESVNQAQISCHI